MPNSAVSVAENRAEALPALFQRYRSQIGDALHSAIDGRSLLVYDLLRYSLGWSDVDGSPSAAAVGKAVRPTLCLFACEASGGPASSALPAAQALELIHHFSLIHDDIQDRDEVRHHRPTVWAVWGDAKALVAGNVLRTVADACLWRLLDEGVGPRQAIEVSGLLTEAYLEMIEGQYMDMEFEGRPDIGISDYMRMISKKTGALIRCAMHVGAIVGGGGPEAVQAFKDCGRSLGLAFQIKDDELGVWGDELATGKPVRADIRRKKNSLPVVYATSQAMGRDKKILEEAYGREVMDDTDVAHVLEVMDSVGAREYAEDLATAHCERALRSLAGVEMPRDARAEIEEMAHFLLVRQH